MNTRRINHLTILLLLIGFGSALVIYLTARPPPFDPLGNALDTKKYLHELKLMGGEVNVLFARFQDWFGGLWHGERLAATIAVLTVLVTLAFRFVALHPDTFAADSGDEEPPPSGPG